MKKLMKKQENTWRNISSLTTRDFIHFWVWILVGSQSLVFMMMNMGIRKKTLSQVLEGKTSSDMAGIKVEGNNKWLIITQNAKKSDQ